MLLIIFNCAKQQNKMGFNYNQKSNRISVLSI